MSSSIESKRNSSMRHRCASPLRLRQWCVIGMTAVKRGHRAGLARRGAMLRPLPALPDALPDMAALHITDIESAINWWRARSPSPDGISACAEVRALAEVYALMVYYHEDECEEQGMPAAAHDAWLGWYARRPTRRASPSARPSRATPCARAAAAASTRCSTGRPSRRRRSAASGGASRCRPRPGASTAMPNARAWPGRRPPAAGELATAPRSGTEPPAVPKGTPQRHAQAA